MSEESRTLSPSEVGTALILAISSGRMADALDLYSDDVVVRDIFGLPEGSEIVGKATLSAGMLNWDPKSTPMYRDIMVENLQCHQSTDPELVVIEWDYRSRFGPDPDDDVVNANVIVLRVRDGLILESRDYHNHVTRAIANGSLPEVIDKLRTVPAARDDE